MALVFAVRAGRDRPAIIDALGGTPSDVRQADTTPTPAPAGDWRIRELFDSRTSGVVVEGMGIVDRVLSDDLQGSRHQRFILRLSSGDTLLVSHNIDLAPRVPGLTAGDTVAFRGQYEWNDRGGLIHWTHHDPDGRREGGWLRVRGQTYR